MFRVYKENHIGSALTILGMATCLWVTTSVHAAPEDKGEAPLSQETEVQPFVGIGVTTAIRTAIETNPEVRASWHEFLSAGDDKDAAFGG